MVSSTSSNSSTNSSCNNSLLHETEDSNSNASKMTSLSGCNIGLTNGTTAKLSLGLINSEGKYLTGENFGFKINATGNTLRKKQKWQLEQDNEEIVYIISPLGCYLSTDKYGKLTCEKTSSDSDCKFLMETNNDGKWSFKSVTYGYYFGGTGDRLHCFSKTPEWWTVHLAIHPQINLRHVLRKRYARLEDDEIHVDEIIPWGSNCLITIEFRDERYAIRTNNGMYLNKDGKLVDSPSFDTLFNIEFYKGCIAFKHVSGKYLTSIGPQGIITARSKCLTKDELFILDPNHVQFSLTAHNGKLVSVKQGIDLSANQTELSDTEIFQLEEDQNSEKWTVRTNSNKYWKLEIAHGIQAIGDGKQPSCLFELIWIRSGHVVLRASNGKYVSAAATGHMKATSDTVTDLEIYKVSLVNRPILVLKCDYGFVGYKNKTSYKLECNKSSFNVIMLESANDSTGSYYLKGSHGSYWEICPDNTLSATSAVPTKFCIELLPNNRMIIKGPNGCYLKGEQNGCLTMNLQDSKNATQWEF